jgi:1-aminocyclopropane-1-carboxylate deaminase
MVSISQPTPEQELQSRFLTDHKIKVYVKRDDLNHPTIMGNKWRKLKYNLQYALDNDFDTLLTYGGAYSNHILASAAAAKLCGLKSVGIIRGDELHPDSNITLQSARNLGMNLEFVTREDFRLMKNELVFPSTINGKVYVLPEGGTNELAIEGCRELIFELSNPYDIYCTAMGTGGTFSGLLKGLSGSGMLMGFSALRGKWIIPEAIKMLNKNRIVFNNYQIYQDDHFGGYGKYSERLLDFIKGFYQDYNILLDPVYTGKMFFSVWEMIKNAQIATGSRILLIHTGGLQGIAGFNERYGTKLPEP